MRFPSGHATDAAAVYGMLAVLLVAVVPRRGAKVAVWAAAVVVVGLVGLSRIYVGGHWLTDVIAGFALGVAWLRCLLTVTRAGEALRRDPTGAGSSVAESAQVSVQGRAEGSSRPPGWRTGSRSDRSDEPAAT
jgi:undecaprenyl-diphosphatase